MTLTVTETVGFTETSTTVLHSALRTPARRRGPGRAAESRLQQFHTLPDHLADNEFIRDYYRADYSIKESLRSFFQIHNETGNIWTHFLGESNIFQRIRTSTLCMAQGRRVTAGTVHCMSDRAAPRPIA